MGACSRASQEEGGPFCAPCRALRPNVEFSRGRFCLSITMFGNYISSQRRSCVSRGGHTSRPSCQRSIGSAWAGQARGPLVSGSAKAQRPRRWLLRPPRPALNRGSETPVLPGPLPGDLLQVSFLLQPEPPPPRLFLHAASQLVTFLNVQRLCVSLLRCGYCQSPFPQVVAIGGRVSPPRETKDNSPLGFVLQPGVPRRYQLTSCLRPLCQHPPAHVLLLSP